MASTTEEMNTGGGGRTVVVVEEVIAHDNGNKIEEIEDENILREMWEETEDAEEKRQLRSRMYKLREERIKEYYGREGHDILENILKPELDILPEDFESVGLPVTTVEGDREFVLISSQSESPDGTIKIESKGAQVKQSVTTTMSSGSVINTGPMSKKAQTNKEVAKDEDIEMIKKRIGQKDRTAQYKDIRKGYSNMNATKSLNSGKRRGSSGEIEIMNVVAGATKRGSKERNVHSTSSSVTNNNNKVIANNMRNVSGSSMEHNGLVSKNRRGAGEGGTKVVNGKSITTTMGGLKSSKVISESNKQDITTMAYSSRKATVTTMMKSTATSSSSYQQQQQQQQQYHHQTSNKIVSSTAIKSSIDSTSNKAFVSNDSQIPLGSVQIEEIIEKVVERDGTNSSARVGRNRSKSKGIDADVINRNLGTAAVQVTKTETRARSTKSSSVNANGSIIGSNGGAVVKEKSTKVVNKSRETSPKRSGRGQQSLSSSSSPPTVATTPGGISRKTTRAGSGSKVKVDETSTMVEVVKKEPEQAKTEESIMRELDILDTYLSQRSISIDEKNNEPEGNGDVEVIMTARKVNGKLEADLGKKKVVSGGGSERVDVMESGEEPPFIKKEYKYGCPGDDEHDHHSRDKNTNEEKNGKSNTTTGKSNMEDEIMSLEEAKEITKGLRAGKSEKKSVNPVKQSGKEIKAKQTIQNNLSSKRRGSKTTIKKSDLPAPAEEVVVKALASIVSTSFKTSAEVQSKQRKYETDILSRQSMFEKKKPVVDTKPEPNPRIRKGSSDSSPERSSPDRSFSAKAKPWKPKQKSKQKEEEDNALVNDDDDDPLRPQTVPKGLDSPGAVLKAKSMFETKAQEAAKDRSSADFDIDKGMSQSAKVSKKAALFEARSRGERVSVSSESSLSVAATEDKENVKQNTQSQDDIDDVRRSDSATPVRGRVISTPEPQSMDKEIKRTTTEINASKNETTVVSTSETRKTENVSNSMRTTWNNNTKIMDEKNDTSSTPARKSSSEVTTIYSSRRRGSRGDVLTESEGKESRQTQSQVKVESGAIQKSKEARTISSNRKSSEGKSPERILESKNVSPKRRPSDGKLTESTEGPRDKPKSTQTTRRLSDTKVKTEEQTRPKEIHLLNGHKESNEKKSRTSNFETMSNKTIKTSSGIISSTTQNISLTTLSNRMTTTELNAIDSMDNIQELEGLLDKATDYDERSKIRGRIRALKRKAALVKKPSTEETNESPDRNFKRSPSNLTSEDVKSKSSSSGFSKPYERRRSSAEIHANKVTSRKTSSELIVESKKESNKSQATTTTESETITNSRRVSREKKVSKEETKLGNVEVSKRKSHVSTSPSRIETTTVDVEKIERRGLGERKLSSETKELLSTRKYSREKIEGESPRRSPDGQESGSLPSSRRNSKDGLTSSRPGSTKGTPESGSPVKVLSRQSSVDKSSPTRTLESVPEVQLKALITKKNETEIMKSSMTREDKYAEDILSRPSVFCSRRQKEKSFVRDESEPEQKSRQTRDSVSPQRSEIPVSSRMKSVAVKATEVSQASSKILLSSPNDFNVEKPKENLEEKSIVEVSSEIHSQNISKIGSVSKVSSKKTSEELCSQTGKSQQTLEECSRPTAASFRKDSEDKSQSSIVSKIQQRQSSEDGQQQESQKTLNTTSTTTASKKNTYTRKSSSKEIKGASSNDSAQEKGDVKSRTSKNQINLNQSVEKSPTSAREEEVTSSNKVDDDDDLTRDQPKRSTSTTTALSSSSRRVTSSAVSSKSFSLSGTSKKQDQSRLQGTETVTSSYGVGPTDDDGTPLFGLRALRKIKQAQEQMAVQKSEPQVESNSSNIGSGGLRSSENFGLRALKKGSTASKGFDDKSPAESSVPQGSTRESKSDFGLSSSKRTTAEGTKSGGSTPSPKSILKKTSSFTSQSSSSIPSTVVKSEEEDRSNNNSDEIGTGDDEERSQSNLDDSSWRRKSVSPSPEAVGTFSRGKVGRSSVKEMSKKFETTETSTSASSSALFNDRSKSCFIRGDSPSRIPSPVRATTTISTKTSVEVKSTHPQNVEVTRTDLEDLEGTGSSGIVMKIECDPPSSDSTGTITRITRTKVTKTSTGRSFLTDQSPIQNLSDVIERMKGEDGEYVQDFKDDEEEEDEEKQQQKETDGRSLLNKFIGAQILMQAVEPMLVTQKVSMSSSLVINNVNVDTETDSAILRQLLAEVDGVDQERVESRLRILESGMKEEQQRSSKPKLQKTLSIAGIQLGGGSSSSETTDVTGELMPLILGQLQSSLENCGGPSASAGSGIHNIDSSNKSHNNNNDNSITQTNSSSSSSSSIADDNNLAKSVSGSCGGGGNNSNSSSNNNSNRSSSTSSSGAEESPVGSAEECLFDSGTESGEDVAPVLSFSPGPPTQIKSEELSEFMEGLRNTLKRNQTKEALLSSYSSQLDAILGESAFGGGGSSIAGAGISYNIIGDSALESGAYKTDIGSEVGLQVENLEESYKTEKVISEESDLVQQVDKVLSLLRDSLVKDPDCIKLPGISGLELNSDPQKGKELIALIDRLKASLVQSENKSEGENKNKAEGESKEETDLQRKASLCSSTSKGKKEEEDKSNLPSVIGTSEEPIVSEKRSAEMLGWAVNRPPDIVPLPWVNHIQSTFTDERKKSIGGGEEVPWKMRASKRRTHGRSHTVGVTQEELAEARRYLQEAAYKSALQEQKQIVIQQSEEQKQLDQENKQLDLEISNALAKSNTLPSNAFASFEENLPNDTITTRQGQKEFNITKQTIGKSEQTSWQKDVEKGLTSIPRPFVKHGMFNESGYQPPPERRMTYASIDESKGAILGIQLQHQQQNPTVHNTKIKPFRTFSLDNAFDPSKSFFTQEETVQIAIHQAAIKKQMSDEEDRRKRRNSLSSYHNIYSPGPQQPARDFSLALPKPYVAPMQQHNQQIIRDSIGIDSGYTEESGSDTRQPRNDQLVLYQSSQMSPTGVTPSTTSTTTSTTFLQQSPSSPNGNNTGNKRIENVQISLKELNSSEFPQLQIAITLNTNNGGTSNNNNGNNNNNCNEIGNMQVQFHPIPNINNISNNNNNNSNGVNNNSTMKQHHNNVVPPALSESSPVSGGSVNSKAMRYKSKNERKKRMKRANTIDIPQPPGFLLSNDDDSEMEDEEDSDTAKNSSIGSGPGGKVHFTYAPFRPKNEGDKKFLAFLEKNNSIAPPTTQTQLLEGNKTRSAHLTANDKFWNNRFFNLKSNFESSSQGSSPSPSPILSPTNRPPRSVSEMALTHGNVSMDVYSKPVWATTDPGQLPPQVRNKLSVFENKSMEAQSSFIAPWRSSAPQIHTQSQGQHQSRYQPQQMYGKGSQGGLNQFVSSSSVYTTNNVRAPPMIQDMKQRSFESQNYDENNVKKPIAMKQGSLEQLSSSSSSTTRTSILPAEGVHMVHATAAALEAMKRSGFGPTAVVQPQARQSYPSQPPPLPPKGSSLQQQEKIELPWAKKEPLSPSQVSSKDPNSGRIFISKARFEQLNQTELVPMHPPISHGVPPPIPPKSVKTPSSYGQHARAPMVLQQQQQHKSFQTASVPNVSNLSNNYGQNSHHGSVASVASPKLGTLGSTQSFDEAFKRKLELEQSKIIQRQSQQIHPPSNKRPVEFQKVPGSAFARKVPVLEPPSSRTSSQEEEEDVAIRKSSIDSTNQDGVMIQTAVTSKVMRGPQQQRALVTSNRMTSVHDEAPAAATRLFNARSNIRNILNQYQAQTQSNEDSDISPPILRANLQLNMPPLAKSMSGDSLLQSHYRPKSLIVGQEELSLQGLSPKQFNQSPSSISPASIPSASPPGPTNRINFPVKSSHHHHPVIPRQRSLSEFPKIATAPNIGVLMIQTDLDRPSGKVQPKFTPTVSSKVPVQQSKQLQQQIQKPIQQQKQPVQQQKVVPQQQPQKQQSKALSQQTETTPSAPKVLKSYPTTDSLQRTSSGSSIFNRAQSLFLSSQESGGGGIPPATKSRPKPPSLPKTHGMFPKQFEAQMSPDSANKKQREIETYFKQQMNEENEKRIMISNTSLKGTILRKSASHSKIMNRQRSLSDGEEDVDKIFESLFKASAVANCLKSAEISVASSSSKSVQMSESKKISQSMSNDSSSSSIQTVSTSSTSSSSFMGGSGVNRFKQMDQQAKANSGGGPLFKFANPGLKASANSAKDILLYWCQCRTRDYENVKIENFSSSWCDGLAFCALIHHFFPDAFDYNSLDPRNRRYNFDLAFRIADEKAGIYPLLDSEDMVLMGRRPDWKCVFTYVQAMYQKLKEFS